MATGTPSHRRVRLGIALRHAREEHELTQQQVAEIVGHSQGWVNKIETAQTARIKQADLDKLLGTYKIVGAKAEELRQFARSPYGERGVWVDTSSSPAWWSEYQEVEREARVIKAVHLEAHDGLIQSEAYMRRQFELYGQVNVEKLVRARLARKEAMFGQDSPPDCTFVLSEGCLRRHMGDPAMMITQLKHLLALSERPYITILVLPFDAHFPATNYGFTFLQFNSATMGDFVSVQYEIGSATIDDEDAMRLFQRRWEVIRSAALGEYDSRRFLRRVLKEYQDIVKGS
ncbi:MAG TPA: helix-turn-helix transcriptional regulator [Actinophytocola sp.]|uniref:helix-turn-helix domain-containing protein n=1 Tax=Actinophytocola sp. TaxID=1872138 RepID=UPI002DFEEC2A|nr:helix-turn-helix transcriptional regulator [Actinophytocola sp.]